MSESKVYTAIEEFKAKYAWDKSLVTGHGPSTVPSPDFRASEVKDTAMWDFVEAAQAAESERASRESF